MIDNDDARELGEIFGKVMGYLIAALLFGFWGEWVFESILSRDCSYFLASLVIFLLLLSKKLSGIVGLTLIFGTIYIWLFI